MALPYAARGRRRNRLSVARARWRRRAAPGTGRAPGLRPRDPADANASPPGTGLAPVPRPRDRAGINGQPVAARAEGVYGRALHEHDPHQARIRARRDRRREDQALGGALRLGNASRQGRAARQEEGSLGGGRDASMTDSAAGDAARMDTQRPRGAWKAALAGAALLALGGCGSMASLNPFAAAGPPAGTPGFVRGFLGGIAAEDPAAALAARNVLSAGGSAVDAAVAAGFTMSVTLPSRAGLGGGGACLVFNPSPRRGGGDRLPGRPAQQPAARHRPPRGGAADGARAVALHTRLPRRPFEELIAPAEQAARFGTEVSRALSRGPRRRGRPAVGRPQCPGASSPGPTASRSAPGRPSPSPTSPRRWAAAHRRRRRPVPGRARPPAGGSFRAAGGGLTVADLRAALPQLLAPVILPSRGSDQIAFLPPPADGGLAAAAAFAALQAGSPRPRPRRAASPSPPPGAGRRGRADAARRPAGAGLWDGHAAGLGRADGLRPRRRGGELRLHHEQPVRHRARGAGHRLPAGGGADTGHVAPPLLSAGLAHNANLRAFRAGFAGAGQQAAPMAVAGPAALHLLRNVAPARCAGRRHAAERARAARRLPELPARHGRASAPR